MPATSPAASAARERGRGTGNSSAQAGGKGDRAHRRGAVAVSQPSRSAHLSTPFQTLYQAFTTSMMPLLYTRFFRAGLEALFLALTA
jgi:hypothetical protein